MSLKALYYKIVAWLKQNIATGRFYGLLFFTFLTVYVVCYSYLLASKYLPDVILQVLALFIQEGTVLNPALAVPDAAVSSSDLPHDLQETQVPDHPILPEAIPQDEVHIHKNVRREGDIEIYNDSWPVVHKEKVYLLMLAICVVGVILETFL